MNVNVLVECSDFPHLLEERMVKILRYKTIHPMPSENELYVKITKEKNKFQAECNFLGEIKTKFQIKAYNPYILAENLYAKIESILAKWRRKNWHKKNSAQSSVSLYSVGPDTHSSLI